MTRPARSLALGLVVLFGLGCRPGPATPPTATAPVAEAPTATPRATPAVAAVPDPVSAESESESESDAPLAVPKRINETYATKTNAKSWARRFEREGREAYDHRQEILATLGLEPTAIVADIGAGSGLFTMVFAQALPKGSVVAVDVQDYFLEHIQERASKKGLTNVRVVRAAQRDVGLDPDSVDVAFMCDVYHHVENPGPYLASLFAAVRPGGRFFVIDYIAEDGVSEEWILEHVRADPATFRREIEAAGFVFEAEHQLLEDNFFYEFSRPAA